MSHLIAGEGRQAITDTKLGAHFNIISQLFHSSEWGL